MSKEDMAAYLGVSIRSLNRTLKQLEDHKNRLQAFIFESFSILSLYSFSILGKSFYNLQDSRKAHLPADRRLMNPNQFLFLARPLFLDFLCFINLFY